jgi:hypothetical protein
MIHHNLSSSDSLLPVSKDTGNFICFGSVWILLVWHPVVYAQALVCVERDLCCEGPPVHWLQVAGEALPATVTAVHGLDYQTRTLRELIASWAIELQKTWNSCVLYSRDFISPGGKVAVFVVLRAPYMKIKVFYCITTYQMVDREVLKERATSIFRVQVARERLFLDYLCTIDATSFSRRLWVLHA